MKDLPERFSRIRAYESGGEWQIDRLRADVRELLGYIEMLETEIGRLYDLFPPMKHVTERTAHAPVATTRGQSV